MASKATTEIQRKFLLKNGADEVVYPDRDLAEKLAVTLNSTKVFNYVELNNEYAIFEIASPNQWAGKKLVDINPRKKYGINILTIKKGDTVVSNMDANYVFEEGDHMLVFGNTEKVLKFTNKFYIKPTPFQNGVGFIIALFQYVEFLYPFRLERQTYKIRSVFASNFHAR